MSVNEVAAKIRADQEAMRDEIVAPLPSPSRRLHELTMAMATRSVAAKVESSTIKQATVGDLKGQYVVEGLTLVRDEDDTLDQWVEKMRVTLYAVHAMLVGINDEMVREEIIPAARQSALQSLRALPNEKGTK